LEEIVAELTSLPRSEIDTAELAQKLGVKRRRAQIILEPITDKRTLGASNLVPKEAVIARLRELVAGEGAKAEQERRARLVAILEKARTEARAPQVLVEAPVSVLRQELENLPPGVSLSPGRIVLEGFQTVEEAQQKILALIMALGNDPDGFAERVTVQSTTINQ
jgi:hypothetical protein